MLGARLRRRCLVLVTVAATSFITPTARAQEPTAATDKDADTDHRPGRREPHYFRAAAEMGGLLTAGWLLYFLKTADQAHADYPDAWTRFRHLRVTFDTNEFMINALGHPAGGGMYQLFSRVNGLTIPEAFVYSTVSSTLWEVAFEAREKPSLNDFIVTPTSGVPVGEVLVHLGDYFNSTPGRARWYHEILGYVFGPAHRMHRAIDGYTHTSRWPADRLGYSSFYTHRFDVLAGATHLVNNLGERGTAVELRFVAEVIGIPGFLRPGRFARTFSDGDAVEALARVNIGSDANALDMLCEANLFGGYTQDIAADGRGLAAMLAFNMGARYANRKLLGRHDQYFMAHLAGPALKLWAVRGDFVSRLELSAHLDFGAIGTLAGPRHIAQYGEDDVASSVVAHNYHHGFGVSGLARGVVSYKFLELGGRAFFGAYESMDDWDRFPERVPSAIHNTDHVAELEGWLGLLPRFAPLHIRAYFEHIPRFSRMSTITATRWDQRIGIAMGASF
jgi:hypothetical protein